MECIEGSRREGPNKELYTLAIRDEYSIGPGRPQVITRELPLDGDPVKRRSFVCDFAQKINTNWEVRIVLTFQSFSKQFPAIKFSSSFLAVFQQFPAFLFVICSKTCLFPP